MEGSAVELGIGTGTVAGMSASFWACGEGDALAVVPTELLLDLLSGDDSAMTLSLSPVALDIAGAAKAPVAVLLSGALPSLMAPFTPPSMTS